MFFSHFTLPSLLKTIFKPSILTLVPSRRPTSKFDKALVKSSLSALCNYLTTWFGAIQLCWTHEDSNVQTVLEWFPCLLSIFVTIFCRCSPPIEQWTTCLLLRYPILHQTIRFFYCFGRFLNLHFNTWSKIWTLTLFMFCLQKDSGVWQLRWGHDHLGKYLS